MRPLRLNALQLRVLADAVRREVSRPRFFAMFNVVTTIVIAAWTAGLYLFFGRQHQQLTLRQLELAVKQAEIGSRQAVSREQLATENLRLDAQLKSLAYGEALESRIRVHDDVTLEAIDRASHSFEADFELRIENISRQRVEVSWVVFEWYLGKLGEPPGGVGIAQINAPPKEERNVYESGPVQWRAYGRKGFRYRSSLLLDRAQFAKKPYIQEGGGPTKSLASGDEAAYTMPLLIHAPDEQWLGLVAIVGINGGSRPADVFWVSRWFPLSGVAASDSKEQGE